MIEAEQCLIYTSNTLNKKVKETNLQFSSYLGELVKTTDKRIRKKKMRVRINSISSSLHRMVHLLTVICKNRGHRKQGCAYTHWQKYAKT